MSGMFNGCSSLKELNLSNFNTYNVTNMSGMFYGRTSSKELNLSSLNTYNVTNMISIFYGCSDELKSKLKVNLGILNKRYLYNWIFIKNKKLFLNLFNLGIYKISIESKLFD